MSTNPDDIGEYRSTQLHQMILDLGADEVRRKALSKEERHRVEIALGVMGDDKQIKSYAHSGLAVTSLPHRECSELIYERKGGANNEITLHVKSGEDLEKQPVGIPYGAPARLLLIHMASEAIKNNSPTVELGAGVTAFMRRIGVTIGGKNVKLFRDQFKRLALCRLTFFEKTIRNTTVVENGTFIKRAELTDGGNLEWQNRVELDDIFYRSLKNHPLPLLESAIHQLTNSSLALDIYIFLSYRLHVLERPTLVPWPSLHAQFGGGFAQMQVFKAHFKTPFEQAMAAYPQARAELDGRGLVMHPSSSPIMPIKHYGRLRLS
jgi:hypothetical protein